MTEPIGPKLLDAMAIRVRLLKLESVLADLSKIALETNLKVWGDPPDYWFRLRLKTGVYPGVGTSPQDAILMALKRAKEAMGMKENA